MIQVQVTPEQVKRNDNLVAYYSEAADKITRIAVVTGAPRDTDTEVVEFSKALGKYFCLPAFAGCYADGERTLTLTYDDAGALKGWE